jgi:hypothetical protein
MTFPSHLTGLIRHMAASSNSRGCPFRGGSSPGQSGTMTGFTLQIAGLTAAGEEFGIIIGGDMTRAAPTTPTLFARPEG